MIIAFLVVLLFLCFIAIGILSVSLSETKASLRRATHALESSQISYESYRKSVSEQRSTCPAGWRTSYSSGKFIDPYRPAATAKEGFVMVCERMVVPPGEESIKFTSSPGFNPSASVIQQKRVECIQMAQAYLGEY